MSEQEANPPPEGEAESRTSGADRNDAYADARCAPPSGCWMEWGRQVNARVEAVAKLARMERDALRAELAAATAGFAAEQAAYVKELERARHSNKVLNIEYQDALKKIDEFYAEIRQLRAQAAEREHALRTLFAAWEERDELREGQPLPVRALLRQVSRLQAENAELRRLLTLSTGSREELFAELEDTYGEVGEAREEVARLRAQAVESERALGEAREDNELLRADVDRLRNATADAVGSWVDARAELADLRRQVVLSPADAKWLCDWLHGEPDVEHDYDRAHALLEGTGQSRREAADEPGADRSPTHDYQHLLEVIRAKLGQGIEYDDLDEIAEAALACAENPYGRAEAADELSREGQRMGLDEPPVVLPWRSPAVRAQVAEQLAETYAGTDYPVPDVDSVIAQALEVVASDTMERAEDQGHCNKVDECAAKAVALRNLAVWLQLAPQGPHAEEADHGAPAGPGARPEDELDDALFLVETAQDFESPDAPYQPAVLEFANAARVLATALRGVPAAGPARDEVHGPTYGAPETSLMFSLNTPREVDHVHGDGSRPPRPDPARRPDVIAAVATALAGMAYHGQLGHSSSRQRVADCVAALRGEWVDGSEFNELLGFRASEAGPPSSTAEDDIERCARALFEHQRTTNGLDTSWDAEVRLHGQWRAAARAVLAEADRG